MKTKKCCRCKKRKFVELFCKNRSTRDGFHFHCKVCHNKIVAEQCNNSKEERKIKRKEYEKRLDVKKRIKEYTSNYCKKNSKSRIEKRKKYIKARPGIQYRWLKSRMERNPVLKFKTKMRTRLWMVMVSFGMKKKTTTENLIGTDYKTAKAHIEKTFKDGMSWDNYGKWHIDHIMPLGLAKTEAELIKLFNYKNLQALWREDNFKKGSQIPYHLID